MLSVIEKLKEISMTKSTEMLIQAIYDQTDFLNAVSFRYTDGAKKKANLRLMVQYAKKYAQNDFFAGVSGFVRYIENIVKMKGDFSSAANTDITDNAVQIKTIHKSKGLEFPFVFLCDTAKNYNESDLSEPLLFHPFHGAAVRFQTRADENGDTSNIKRYKTFPQFILSLVKKNELRAESLRLLYVALTRAKERLFISFSEEDLDDLSDNFSSPEDCINFLSLFTYVFGKTEEGGIFRNEPIINNENAVFKTIVIDGNNDEKSNEVNTKIYKPNEETVARIISTWSKKYPFPDVNKTAKLSVTEIALNSDLAKVYSVKNISLHFDTAIAATPALTASEKGTAMHRFMQKCDIRTQNVREEINKLMSDGLLSKPEAESLNITRLEKYFKSHFYRRHIFGVSDEKIHREYKIYAKLCDIHLDETLKREYNISENSFLQGVADLVIETEDGLLLADYKTNGNYFAPENGLSAEELFTEHMKKLYSLQINIYAAAVSAIFGKPVKNAYLYSFAINREIRIF
jgi:ATP-dependent helicase/nuclease subunit A